MWEEVLVKLKVKLVLLFMGLLLLFSLFFFGVFSISRVYVTGQTKHVDYKYMLTSISEVENMHMYTSLRKLQARLLQHPWVKNIDIQKSWPDVLQITIFERRPIANWGKQGFLDSEAKLYFPEDYVMNTNLPFIEAPNDAVGDVFQVLQVIDKASYKYLKPTNIIFTDWGAIQVKFQNNIEVKLGHHYILRRLQRFYQVVNKHEFADCLKKYCIFDMRYAKGFTLRKL